MREQPDIAAPATSSAPVECTTWPSSSGIAHDGASSPRLEHRPDDPPNVTRAIAPGIEALIDNAFMYHAPHGDQVAHYARIRNEARELAKTIGILTPPSREQALALTNLEQAVMWANAAIARHT